MERKRDLALAMLSTRCEQNAGKAARAVSDFEFFFFPILDFFSFKLF